MLTKNCIVCDNEISSLGKSKKYWQKIKYCSNKCAGVAWRGHAAPKSAFKKGFTPWNKGKKHSPETIKKLIIVNNLHKMIGDNHPNWKGDKAGYTSIHIWVTKYKKRPSECEHCGKRKSYPLHWANVDHKYKRILADYMALCASCHKKYDLEHGLCNH